MTSLPADILAKLRRIGRQFTPENNELVRRLLAPRHEAAGYLALRVVRDVAYGPDPRHRLDLHTPGAAAPGGGAPVLLFVHGGGFVGGNKSEPGSPFYDHIGGWAAARGFVAATMTYRLAPVHQWPSGAEDVAAAVACVRDRAAGVGGDPEKIVLMGHSAGATHVASYLAGHAAGGGSPAADLAGAVLLSGIYDPGATEPNVPMRAYYGRDTASYGARTAVPGLVKLELPLLIALAEYDMPVFSKQAVVLLDAMLAEHGVLPPVVTVPGHTHLSEILSLGLDDAAFGAVLERFVRQVTGG
ncbi:alpha/beta hydrolase [Streptomyces sp. 7-21]|uniref:alpha/beta hydrolase n=1 Tax=Streptomyces sp. 7-21 TaxID=2802283 RepID=UPI00191E286E|nr:alpha/beta hydrolase [Streptomyces sp. 7-21]MBL1067899.1 alpha/beta hydrolase [Streptomyces sp. 7-21]